MTVGELRRKLEAIGDDDLLLYFHDLDHGRMPIETLVVETWVEKFVHHKWIEPEHFGITAGWRRVVTQQEVKGVVLE